MFNNKRKQSKYYVGAENTLGLSKTKKILLAVLGVLMAVCIALGVEFGVPSNARALDNGSPDLDCPNFTLTNMTKYTGATSEFTHNGYYLMTNGGVAGGVEKVAMANFSGVTYQQFNIAVQFRLWSDWSEGLGRIGLYLWYVDDGNFCKLSMWTDSGSHKVTKINIEQRVGQTPDANGNYNSTWWGDITPAYDITWGYGINILYVNGTCDGTNSSAAVFIDGKHVATCSRSGSTFGPAATSSLVNAGVFTSNRDVYFIGFACTDGYVWGNEWGKTAILQTGANEYVMGNSMNGYGYVQSVPINNTAAYSVTAKMHVAKISTNQRLNLNLAAAQQKNDITGGLNVTALQLTMWIIDTTRFYWTVQWTTAQCNADGSTTNWTEEVIITASQAGEVGTSGVALNDSSCTVKAIVEIFDDGTAFQLFVGGNRVAAPDGKTTFWTNKLTTTTKQYGTSATVLSRNVVGFGGSNTVDEDAFVYLHGLTVNTSEAPIATLTVNYANASSQWVTATDVDITTTTSGENIGTHTLSAGGTDTITGDSHGTITLKFAKKASGNYIIKVNDSSAPASSAMNPNNSCTYNWDRTVNRTITVYVWQVVSLTVKYASSNASTATNVNVTTAKGVASATSIASGASSTINCITGGTVSVTFAKVASRNYIVKCAEGTSAPSAPAAPFTVQNSTSYTWTATADKTVSVGVWEVYVLTVKYQNTPTQWENATALSVSASVGTPSASSISADGTVTINGINAGTSKITLAKSASGYNYYLSTSATAPTSNYSANNSISVDWARTADQTVNVYVWQIVTLTVNYPNATANRVTATPLTVSASAGTLSANSVNEGGSVTVNALSGGTSTLTLTKSASGNYIVKVGDTTAPANNASANDTTTYTWTKTASASVNVAVWQVFDVSYAWSGVDVASASTSQVYGTTSVVDLSSAKADALMDNFDATLKSTETKLFWSVDDGTFYDIGENYGVPTKNVKFTAVTASFDTTSDDVNIYSKDATFGIRFKSGLTFTSYNYLRTLSGITLERNTYVAKTESALSAETYVANDGIQIRNYNSNGWYNGTNAYIVGSGESFEFAGSWVGVNPQNYLLSLVSRADLRVTYTLTDGTSKTATVYSATKSADSLYKEALAEYNGGSYRSAELSLLKSILDRVVVLDASGNVSATGYTPGYSTSVSGKVITVTASAAPYIVTLDGSAVVKLSSGQYKFNTAKVASVEKDGTNLIITLK